MSPHFQQNKPRNLPSSPSEGGKRVISGLFTDKKHVSVFAKIGLYGKLHNKKHVFLKSRAKSYFLLQRRQKALGKTTMKAKVLKLQAYG